MYERLPQPQLNCHRHRLLATPSRPPMPSLLPPCSGCGAGLTPCLPCMPVAVEVMAEVLAPLPGGAAADLKVRSHSRLASAGSRTGVPRHQCCLAKRQQTGYVRKGMMWCHGQQGLQMIAESPLKLNTIYTFNHQKSRVIAQSDKKTYRQDTPSVIGRVIGFLQLFFFSASGSCL